jgi:hypothetical protein
MFDNSHWWVDQDWRDGKEPDFKGDAAAAADYAAAAAFELARRHPRVLEVYNLPGQPDRPAPDVLLAPIACLRDIGLKPWPKLIEREKASWKQCMGSLKGVEMRPDSAKCYSVTRLALAIAHVSTTGDNRLDNFKLPTPALAEQFVRVSAAIAETQGFLIIAIAPDLPQEEAASLLAREYQRHRKSTAAKPRARCYHWLDLITRLEDNMKSPPKGAEAVAAANEIVRRYRRVMESLRFGRRHLGGMLKL